MRNSDTADATRPTLLIIFCSTRPQRICDRVGEWFVERATDQGSFVVDVVDLAELALPFMDEPEHPRLGQYVHQHTKDWSARVEQADAVVFVMPEYNHGYSAPLKNAIDYLHAEWNYKPAGFVSYGGVAAGTRAVQQLKPVLAALRMTPVVDAVSIPMVFRMLSEDGLSAGEPLELAADAMLDELRRLETTLRPLRAGAADREPVPS